MDREITKSKIGKILLSESDIFASISSLAEKIKTTYIHTNKVVALVLLDGAKRFADELFMRIENSKFELRYIRVKSYGGTDSMGHIEIKGNIGDVRGEDVLIVDDIYDKGSTLSAILRMVEKEQPRNIRTCVMLNKKTERTEHVDIDFESASVPDFFVVGYGLDYNGQFRELPFIASLDITPD